MPLSNAKAGLVVIFLAMLPHVSAQTVVIKLVNGRNGRPMSDSYVNVWIGNKEKAALPIPTDKRGIAQLRLTDNDADVDKPCPNCGYSKTPVVKYDATVRVQAGYVLCESRKSDYSWLSIMAFPTQKVLEQGIVTANTCGNATAPPRPGEVIIFVRPLTWWEKLKQ